mmetsp:Transcript_73791/g.130085  ORF Transcript_73791/g.130085 Transcript_73791/m.130085 type:complete len:206 (-) Transcript_73791:1187-1804(-)
MRLGTWGSTGRCVGFGGCTCLPLLGGRLEGQVLMVQDDVGFSLHLCHPWSFRLLWSLEFRWFAVLRHYLENAHVERRGLRVVNIDCPRLGYFWGGLSDGQDRFGRGRLQVVDQQTAMTRHKRFLYWRRDTQGLPVGDVDWGLTIGGGWLGAWGLGPGPGPGPWSGQLRQLFHLRLRPARLLCLSKVVMGLGEHIHNLVVDLLGRL